MPGRSPFKISGSHVHRVKCRCESAFEIKQIQFAFSLRAVCHERSARCGQSECLSLKRQFSGSYDTKHPATFEKPHIAITVIKVVTDRIQQPRQQSLSHV